MLNEQLQKKVKQSIKLLQSVQKRYDGEIEIAYSGGKDSDVILQLAKEAGIKYRAKTSFFHLVAQKGFPSRFMRFCCEELKEYKVLDKSIIGVRKAESRKRNEIYNEPTECRYFGAKKEENHVEQIYPILEWTDEDVRDFIIDRKLKLAPIYYNSGGGKSTCRNVSAACAVLSPQGASALSSFRNIPR